MITNIEQKHIAAITKIYNFYIAETPVTFEEIAVSEQQMAGRVAKVKAADFPWLVAVNEAGEVLGYAYACTFKERSAYRFSAEATVYLDPEYVGKGWGGKLYQALFDLLKSNGIHVVIGGITLPNEASVALHHKMGMEQVAQFKQVGRKFDNWFDVGYWQKYL